MKSFKFYKVAKLIRINLSSFFYINFIYILSKVKILKMLKVTFKKLLLEERKKKITLLKLSQRNQPKMSNQFLQSYKMKRTTKTIYFSIIFFLLVQIYLIYLHFLLIIPKTSVICIKFIEPWIDWLMDIAELQNKRNK